MRMKEYAVKLHVYGTVTVLVSAPDYEEAEELALEEVYNEDFNDWDLDFDVIESEEELGGYDD